MSLPHVILTVLSHRNATGYDITKEFTCAIGHFWKASHQQVYRELNKLADNGSVSCQLEPQEGKPDRKVYSITEIGRQALYEWFLQPSKQPTIRDEISAKLLSCAIFDSAPMIQHLQSLIEESHLMLSHYYELERTHYANRHSLSRQTRLERLTLRRGIHNRQAWLIWAEEVLEELREMETEPELESKESLVAVD